EILDARRFEREFLLKAREYSFEEANSRYPTLLRMELAKFRGVLDKIGRTTPDDATTAQLRQLRRDVDLYEHEFLKVVELFGRIRRIDVGLEGRVHAKARALQSL